MTNSERLKIYEGFFHQMNVYFLTMNRDRISEANSLIKDWSYAHRQGNGCLTARQQNTLVNNVVRKMRDFV